MKDGALPKARQRRIGPQELPPGRIAEALRSLLCGGKGPAFVVASMGRAGSTAVRAAIAKGLAERRFGPLGRAVWEKFAADAWDLAGARLYGGIAYKTHDLPPGKPGPPAKFVFTFCPASDTAVSTYLKAERSGGRKWLRLHLDHMGASGPAEDLLRRDLLRLREQIGGWTADTGLDVLAMRYDTLWEHVDVLSDFVGFPVSLPPFRARRASTADPRIARRARALYRDLDARIAALPDVFRPCGGGA